MWWIDVPTLLFQKKTDNQSPDLGLILIVLKDRNDNNKIYTRKYQVHMSVGNQAQTAREHTPKASIHYTEIRRQQGEQLRSM